MKNIRQDIFEFISTHECIVSNDMNNKDEDIKVTFTTFGNRAGCHALYDVIELLDNDTKLKVVGMMKNKKVED